MTSASTVMDRIDVLCRGFDPAAMRVPTKMIDAADDVVEEIQDEQNHPGAPVQELRYLLRWGGDPGGLLSRISGSHCLRRATVLLDLAIYNGGETTEKWFKEQALVLADAYGQLRSLLEDPNNWNKAITGWVQARDFRCGEPVPEADRIYLAASFVVVFRETVGSM